VTTRPPDGAIVIRRRSADDLDRCEALLRIVHLQDSYPFYLPSDVRGFVADPSALASWVAIDGDEVLGHVALHPGSTEPVIRLATEATGWPAAGFGVISRLLVAPETRGRQLGLRLLARATEEALMLGLRPLLDVDTSKPAAIALYEGAGWRRLGQVTSVFEGGSLDEFVYVLD